jgi:hypothetical protein
MERTSVLLRLSSEHEAEIKAAAASLGQSVTKFLTDAALRRARQVMKRQPSRGVHSGVPSFFRACCYEAANGGGGYSVPGWHLANALGSQIPYDLDMDEWQAEVEALHQLIADKDDEGVWAWFKRHYPKCMALVPARRREQFVAGVRRAEEDGRIGL